MGTSANNKHDQNLSGSEPAVSIATLKKKLLESEARFRTLAESSPDIVVRHGKDFRYLYVSPQIEKFSGVKASEYIGKSYREMGFSEEHAAFFDYHLTQVFQSKQQYDVEYEIREQGFQIHSKLVPEFGENGEVASVLVLSREISDSRKAEEELRDIRARQDQTLAILQSLLENAPIGFAFFDREHRYVRINSVLADINGVEAEMHLGKTLKAVLPGMSDTVDQMIDDVFSTGKPVMNLEISGETPKQPGITRYWLAGFYPIYTDFGDTVDMVGVVASEITDRKVAETRIKESENRFRILAETLPQMVWTLTPDGMPEWVSAQWKRYSGIDNAVKAWIYMVHPEDKSKSEKAWQDCILTGKELNTEVRLRNAAGEYRYHTSVGIPVKDNEGNVVKWVGALTDNQDEKSFAEKMRKEVEERTKDLERKNADLANTELFLATVLDSSVELVASFDNGLRYTYVNRRVEESFDLDRNEIIGKHLLEISPGLENTNFYADLQRGLRGERVHISKREIYSKPGTFVENYIIPIINDGKVDGIVTLSRDISQIIQLTDQLQKMVYELQRSNDDLQQFAHVASHDLKEPVRKAMTFGSRLRDEFQDILPDKAKQYIEKMEGATGRMYDMIEGVLRYSSVSAMEHENDEVDLLELLGEIESDLEIPLAQKGGSISYGKLENLRGSRLLFYQLFYNLINNALKFSKANIPLSIMVVSEPANPLEVKHAGLNPAEPHVKIQVSDNGIGFSTEQASRIFGTFTRLHPKDKYEGTGLGLALCKKIVERHQGSIYAKGKENVGATFVVLLPA